ncbi:MAG: hypothetical protein ABIR96_12635 [Bdellovibrionota bacterium]
MTFTFKHSLMLSTVVFLGACGSDSTKSSVSLKGGSAATTNTMAILSGGNLNASVMKFKVYKFAVSSHTDCSSPVTVFENTAGVEKDMLLGPTFGVGTIPNGDYSCVMIELSKIIKTASATTSGGCTAGAQFSDVICQDGQASQLIDGTPVTCSGDSANAQNVTLFITTVSDGDSGNRSLLPPLSTTDTTSGLKLSAAFSVDSLTSGTLTVDPRNFLDGSGGYCSTSAPTFSFVR